LLPRRRTKAFCRRTKQCVGNFANDWGVSHGKKDRKIWELNGKKEVLRKIFLEEVFFCFS
jgi:hypothetical protein